MPGEERRDGGGKGFPRRGSGCAQAARPATGARGARAFGRTGFPLWIGQGTANVLRRTLPIETQRKAKMSYFTYEPAPTLTSTMRPANWTWLTQAYFSALVCMVGAVVK